MKSKSAELSSPAFGVDRPKFSRRGSKFPPLEWGEGSCLLRQDISARTGTLVGWVGRTLLP